MDKAAQEKCVIHSLKELTQEERQQAYKLPRKAGMIAFLIEIFVITAFGLYPHSSHGIDWSSVDLIIETGFVVMSTGAVISLTLKKSLSSLGLVLLDKMYMNPSFGETNQPFSRSQSHSCHSQSYSGHMSINPSSGHSMVGSSRTDTSGNPFGSRSW
ncbi:MAG: hypothetical protein NXI01_08115 [Gammaproteobacteria bacterium]|nr:hypothetical protein [Gammaproteobacteria bacterium]